MVKQNRSAFLRVACPECETSQVVFNKASMIVKCLSCGAVVSETIGSGRDTGAAVAEDGLPNAAADTSPAAALWPPGRG